MIIAIDLGTTNSLVSVFQNGRSVIIPNALGEKLTPSCISIDEDGTFLVGRAAKIRLESHPLSSIGLFKRTMGSNKTYKIGTRSFRSEELSALIISALKEDAEIFLGHEITEAIISVPAYFSDAQRRATKTAGRIAGLNVDRLINEPTAAALSYGLHITEDTQFLVFDLGGGTFDISILELFDGVMEVRSSAGDNHLGGEDFLSGLIDDVVKAQNLDPIIVKDPFFRQYLRQKMEKVMHQLSTESAVKELISWKDKHFEIEYTREQFEEISKPLITRLSAPIEGALRDARIRSSELDNIVLAGGATRMPMIKNLVTKMFGRFPMCDHNPDEAIVLGTAVQAGLKMNDAALGEIVMTDVCPYTLSTEIVREIDGRYIEGFSMAIIERNTVIPASRSKKMLPLYEDQDHLEIGIFQGEARMVKDNIKLGVLNINLPRIDNIQEKAVEIRYTYDVDGLLEVEVTIVRSGEKKILVIENNPGVLTESEINTRLKIFETLKIHPRDTIVNRTLMAEAEHLFTRLKGEVRDYLGDETSRFESIINRQDENEIRKGAKHFREILDTIQDNQYLDT